MQPHDAQVFLYHIYTLAYQFGDAQTALHPEEWKTSSRKRAVFYQQATSLRAAVDSLRTPWNGFYKNPGDAALGRETLGALKKLMPEADALTKSIADAAGASAAASYQKSATDLAELEGQLEAYVRGLEAGLEASVSTKGVEAKSQAAQTPPETGAKAKTQGPVAVSASGPSAASSSAPAPPNSQPAAASQTPKTPTPASAASATITSPPAPAQPAPQAPVAMSPTEVQALLYKIYAAGYRITDLTGSLPVDKWKLSDQERAALTEKADSLRGALAEAEKQRSEFYKHPDDLELGRASVSALQSVSVRLDDFTATLATTPGATAASDYSQSAADLTALTHRLEPYVAYLEARASTLVGGGLDTEIVRPSGASAPLTGASAAQPRLNTDQIKGVLDQAYVPALRLKDLLGQEHPEAWKVSDAQRSAFRDASQVLSARLADLEKWRGQFEAHPETLQNAFETYASLGKLPRPAETVGRLVSQYESPKIGDQYLNSAQQVAIFRDLLEPHVADLLGAYDQQTGTVERNFRACETELSYAMRPSQAAAVPMHNVNPVFQGHPATRHVNHTENSASTHAAVKKANHTKNPAKTATAEKPKQ
jgi:hypothetical protein